MKGFMIYGSLFSEYHDISLLLIVCKRTWSIFIVETFFNHQVKKLR